jgi:hypothetical protein
MGMVESHGLGGLKRIWSPKGVGVPEQLGPVSSGVVEFFADHTERRSYRYTIRAMNVVRTRTRCMHQSMISTYSPCPFPIYKAYRETNSITRSTIHSSRFAVDIDHAAVSIPTKVSANIPKGRSRALRSCEAVLLHRP